jgi:hypothetical protein
MHVNEKEGRSTEANLTDANQVDPVPTHHVNPAQIADSRPIADPRAGAFIEEFEALRSRAKEALLLAQVFQRRAYNKGRLDTEFEVGDFVVINAHSLRLLRDDKGRGKKLLLKYDGPFEISEKLGPVTYRLRLPISYGIHPIINIAHLEPYNISPPELGERPHRSINRDDFDKLPEVEIEKILGERWRKVRGRRVQQFKVRWKGFGPEDDEWLTKRGLCNAPEVLSFWIDQGRAGTLA